MTQPAAFTDLDNDLREHPVSDSFAINVSDRPLDIGPEIQAEVDGLWQSALTSSEKSLFDGSILSVTEITETIVTVRHSSYRFYYAQQAQPSLFSVLRIRPLACSGVLRCKDGLVFARRAQDVFLDPGFWELAPSGTLDSQAINADGSVDVSGFLLRELHEELAIEPAEANCGRIVGLFEHRVGHGIDIAMDIETNLSAIEVRNRFSAKKNTEYDAIDIVPAGELTSFVQKQAGQCVGLSTILAERFSSV